LLALASESFSDIAAPGQFLPHFQHDIFFAWIFFPLALLLVSNIELDEVLSSLFILLSSEIILK
jgi:hypothetical protein